MTQKIGVLSVDLTADSASLQTELKKAQGAVRTLSDRMEREFSQSSTAIQRLERGFAGLGAAAQRFGAALATLAGASALAQTIYGVAQAGDRLTQSIGRLTVATGSITTANRVYDQLYQNSLRTGAAIGESVSAFQRFAIAARQIGATNGEIVNIVRLLQQAGTIAGASASETASATIQLGQALASGRLQGDELRSILEAMPNLAEALARELGVGIGQLRKMGEEGKLTADVVMPALQRAARGINEEFSRLPPTLQRSVDILGQAVERLRAAVDAAAGLSPFLARALGPDGLAGTVDTIRRRTTPTPIEAAQNSVDDSRSALIQARRAREAEEATTRRAREGSSAFEANQRRLENLRNAEAAAQRRLTEAEGEVRRLRGLGQQESVREAEEAAGQRVASAQEGARQELTTLRESLDARAKIRREAAERERTIARAFETGAISATQRDADIAASNRKRDDELRAAANRGAPETGKVAEYIQSLREQATAQQAETAAVGQSAAERASALAILEAESRARDDAQRGLRASAALTDTERAAIVAAASARADSADAARRATAAGEEGLRVTESVRTEEERRAIRLKELNELLKQGSIDQETFNRASRQVAEGGRNAANEWQGFGEIASSAFEDAIINGEKLRDVLRAVVQDISKLVIRNTVSQPLSNALGSLINGASGGGGAGVTFEGLAKLLGFGGAGAPPGLAAGGPAYAGQIYQVGERGRELFIPDTDGRIIPNHELRAAERRGGGGRGGGGGDTVVVNFQYSGSAREFGANATQIGGQLAAAAQRGMRR